VNRPLGAHAALYWAMLFCNCAVPQMYWWPSLRRSALALFGGSTLIVIGMWLERFILIVTSLEKDFLPSSWHVYEPTWVDLSIFTGTIGLFMFLYLLFVGFVPVVPIHEVKHLRHELEKGAAA
jgi:molybdopterin-containing oxidoreductase family membrane subunit